MLILCCFRGRVDTLIKMNLNLFAVAGKANSSVCAELVLNEIILVRLEKYPAAIESEWQ